uniref:Uncharacterized protein n=1 Tax=Globisporangium ultimum (strain ATCC 200006 / CBS 805.95 / DAOM BR144) TaxID=431595 RepID=K3X602_GLOUD
MAIDKDCFPACDETDVVHSLSLNPSSQAKTQELCGVTLLFFLLYCARPAIVHRCD